MSVISTLGNDGLASCGHAHVHSHDVLSWGSDGCAGGTLLLSRGFSHLLASFSQDTDRASAGRDPERVPPALGGECPPDPVSLQGRKLLRRLGLTPSQASPQHSGVGRLSTAGSHLLGSFIPRLAPQTGQKGQGWWVNGPQFPAGGPG